MSTTRVYIALGSNLMDRVNNIRVAIDRLSDMAEGEIIKSSFYMTDPQDMEDDAEEFANAVVGFGTTLSARELLTSLQTIEVSMGRPRFHGVNESRIIDLDLITYGRQLVTENDLIVPHPRAHTRAFVMLPLTEIDPEVASWLRTRSESK